MSDAMHAILGNIVKLEVDAIVNAANSTLLGGGGVDGAIHDAAGPELLEACRHLGGCPPGEARITPGFALKARYVIHTVGPIWRGGMTGEGSLLASCYANSLALAAQHGASSLAFPSISTGAFGFPINEAAPIAIETVETFLKTNGKLGKVLFCCFSKEDLAIYQRLLSRRRV
jgi:O-acetyl-ADP-ribose deacetylase (regulator of RNase III)